MYNIVDAYGKLPSVKPISPPLTDPWLDAAMAMRAKDAGLQTAHASLWYVYVWIKWAVEVGYTYHHCT